MTIKGVYYLFKVDFTREIKISVNITDKQTVAFHKILLQMKHPQQELIK